MAELETLKSVAEIKRLECAIDAKAFSIWLNTLIPANFILVVGAALLSLVAGTAMFVEDGFLTRQCAGTLAFISAAFTVIHNKLNCDQHQAECRRLKGVYQSLSEDYENLRIETDAEKFKSQLKQLNDQRGQIMKSSSTWPSAYSHERARKLVQSQTV